MDTSTLTLIYPYEIPDSMDDEYISAEEAAALLGVSVTTLYAYVSRKGCVRNRCRARVRAATGVTMWRLRRKGRQPAFAPGELQRESRITLLTEHGPYYRGRSAAELAETASVEAVAALLWDVEEEKAFTARAPRCPAHFVELDAVLAGEPAVDRAVAHLPFLEHANAHAHDLTPIGMARSGPTSFAG
jgi:citrate synthase